MKSRFAADEAERRVRAVRDDPAGRVALAAEAYPAALVGYGRAELAFLRWELARGVLHPELGSPWWRAVNDRLLRDKMEGRILAAEGGTASTPGARGWQEFLAAPSPSSWYRAHNRSVVSGYLDHVELAVNECAAERFMINVTLARMLFTHALIERPGLLLGRFARLGPRAGDPRTRSVGLFLNLRNVFPEVYPLGDISVEQVITLEGRVARMIDYGLIVPKLDATYDFAAETLQEPRLPALIADGVLRYAGPTVPATAFRADAITRLVASATRRH
ncbi:hypothetical protein ACFXHA_31570 [Nocardia sp. NPDC059240]|uniref:hypothetical protein n=1 Tax=Nocardia sp. NPDC059240 TaxID=3346786 RepID=UPI0036C9B14A